jgi:hypothetical protein
MAHAFMPHGRTTQRGFRVAARQTLESRSSVPTCRNRQRMGGTGRPIRPVGGGRFRQSRIDEPGQPRTSVRLTPGDGAAGPQGRDRPWACVLTAISRPSRHASVCITQGCQIGRDDGTTSQETARPRARRHPPQALFAAYGGRLGHLDHTGHVLPRHAPSQGPGSRRNRGVVDPPRGAAEGRGLHPTPSPQRLAVPLPRRAQTPAQPASRRHPGPPAHTPADGADHSRSPAGHRAWVRYPCVDGHVALRHGLAPDGMSAASRQRPSIVLWRDRANSPGGGIRTKWGVRHRYLPSW